MLGVLQRALEKTARAELSKTVVVLLPRSFSLVTSKVMCVVTNDVEIQAGLPFRAELARFL